MVGILPQLSYIGQEGWHNVLLDKDTPGPQLGPCGEQEVTELHLSWHPCYLETEPQIPQLTTS